MRTKPAIPEPQGKTPMERLDWAFRTVLKVPKEALVKDEKAARHPRPKKEQKPHWGNTVPVRICRTCGVEFTPPQPPAKPFGRYIDECRECAYPAATPDKPEDPKLAAGRRKIEQLLKKAGHKPSKAAELAATAFDEPLPPGFWDCLLLTFGNNVQVAGAARRWTAPNRRTHANCGYR
jgi:hypothetical protein